MGMQRAIVTWVCDLCHTEECTDNRTRLPENWVFQSGVLGPKPSWIRDDLYNFLLRKAPPTQITFCKNCKLSIRDFINSGLATFRSNFQELIKDSTFAPGVRPTTERQTAADLCNNYLAHVRAYCLKEPITGTDDRPDEIFMRAIESKIDISEDRKDGFRKELMNFIGSLAVDGKQFSCSTNARLKQAFEAYIKDGE